MLLQRWSVGGCPLTDCSANTTTQVTPISTQYGSSLAPRKSRPCQTPNPTSTGSRWRSATEQRALLGAPVVGVWLPLAGEVLRPGRIYADHGAPLTGLSSAHATVLAHCPPVPAKETTPDAARLGAKISETANPQDASSIRQRRPLSRTDGTSPSDQTP